MTCARPMAANTTHQEKTRSTVPHGRSPPTAAHKSSGGFSSGSGEPRDSGVTPPDQYSGCDVDVDCQGGAGSLTGRDRSQADQALFEHSGRGHEPAPVDAGGGGAAAPSGSAPPRPLPP